MVVFYCGELLCGGLCCIMLCVWAVYSRVWCCCEDVCIYVVVLYVCVYTVMLCI